MKFTVTWKPSVRDRLAAIWTDARDRGAVTAAANTIDALLREDPLEQGESRSESVRILIVNPLAVVFEVHEPDRLVQVLSVRQLPVRPR